MTKISNRTRIQHWCGDGGMAEHLATASFS